MLPFSRFRCLVLTLAAGALGLCASQPAHADDLPALNTSATTEHFQGKFIWADLFTRDPGAAAQFYSSLFGWQSATLNRTGSNGAAHQYVILSNEGRPIAGVALLNAKLPESHGRWVGYISVPDVMQAVSAAKSAGGKVLFPAKTLPQRGAQAVLLNPDGTELGVMSSSSGDPGEYAPDAGDWTWAELFARDPGAAARYYQPLGGYDVLQDSREGQTGSFVLTSGGYSRASVGPIPDRPNARPAWLLFVRVDSVKDTVAKVAGLGGRVLRGPTDEPTEYWKAVVADPTGGVIGLVQLEDAAASRTTPPTPADAAAAAPSTTGGSAP